MDWRRVLPASTAMASAVEGVCADKFVEVTMNWLSSLALLAFASFVPALRDKPMRGSVDLLWALPTVVHTSCPL